MQRVFIICVSRKIDTRMKNFASISSDAIQFLNCLHFRFYQIFWYSGQTTCKRHIFTLFRMMRVTLFRIALRLVDVFVVILQYLMELLKYLSKIWIDWSLLKALFIFFQTSKPVFTPQSGLKWVVILKKVLELLVEKHSFQLFSRYRFKTVNLKGQWSISLRRFERFDDLLQPPKIWLEPEIAFHMISKFWQNPIYAVQNAKSAV